MKEKERLKKVIKNFEDVCIDLATNRRTVDYTEFEQKRSDLLSESSIKKIIPDWIIDNRYGSQFWQFIKKKFDNYADRRNFIWSSFSELHEFSENGLNSPVVISVDKTLDSIKNNSIEELWRKVHTRVQDDPEGSITVANTMLETTLKYILDKQDIEYTSKSDMTDLYKKVSNILNLSQAEHHEQVFKQILQGISSVVYGLGTLRNKYSDAHGRGKYDMKPEKRHVELVVNLASSMSIFLLESYLNKVENTNKTI